MPKTPYAPLSKKDQVKIDKVKQAEQDRINAVIDLAQACVGDPKFINYKENFEKMVDDAFAKLAQPMDPDPIKDAHYLRSCINTIIVLKRLLTAPQRDIKRGKK